MRREWTRLMAEQGRVKPLGLLLAIVLAALLLIEQELTDYDRVAEELADREAVIQEGQARSALIEKLEKTLADRQTQLAGLSARLVASDAQVPGDAASKYSEALKSWYASHGIAQAAVSAVMPRSEGLQYLRATVEAPMRLEQFVKLMQAKSAAPLALRLVEAEVRGNDATQPSGLVTRMTWEALRAPSKPVEAEPVAGKGAVGKSNASRAAGKNDKAAGEKPSGEKTGGKTVERGKSALPASLATEDKRK